jgi:hypothetical protein
MAISLGIFDSSSENRVFSSLEQRLVTFTTKRSNLCMYSMMLAGSIAFLILFTSEDRIKADIGGISSDARLRPHGSYELRISLRGCSDLFLLWTVIKARAKNRTFHPFRDSWMSAIPDFSASQTSRDFREEGQQPTYAVQQKPPLFDHLVAGCDHPAALESQSRYSQD